VNDLHTKDLETLRHIHGQLRDLATRDMDEQRRARYTSLASQCDALIREIERETAVKPHLV
jgi:hypothetical protein